MDTKTLVVGQEVSLESGLYRCRGKVDQITPSGVVFVRGMHDDGTWNDGCGMLRFNRSGWGSDEQGTLEYGRWYIAEEPDICDSKVGGCGKPPPDERDEDWTYLACHTPNIGS